jgi:uncharacterized protein (UPF0371 family)
MASQQSKIIISVTKSGTLQARVISDTSEPSFEVTIGGSEWMAGKGSKYSQIILEKAAALVNNLQKQLADVVREVKLQQPDTSPALQGEVMKKEKEGKPNQERRLYTRRRNNIQNYIGKRSAR